MPLDSGYLSNSPFMLNAPHAQAGLTTVGLQCTTPQPSLSSGTRISVTPAEVPGYSLKLGLTQAGMETSFTYSLNSAADSQFSTLGGWAQPEMDEVNTASPANDYKTDFYTFLGIRRVAAGSPTTQRQPPFSGTLPPMEYRVYCLTRSSFLSHLATPACRRR